MKPIETEEQYKEALERIEKLWDVPVGSPEFEELIELVDHVSEYEEALLEPRNAVSSRNYLN